MADAETILVIFLSVALAVLLVLSIIFLIFLIDIIQRVRRVTIKVENITDRAEEAVETIRQAAVPVAFGRLVSTLADLFGRKNKQDKEE